MKQLLAVLFGAGLVACTESPAPTATVPSYPYARYATGAPASSPENSPYRRWTTAQLQQRRLDLYRMVPQGQTRRGVPFYVYHGDTLPQQDEIFAIESELNRRYQAGDTSAELVRPIPGVQHPS